MEPVDQIFILMLINICIFLITTLPLDIYKIISRRSEAFDQAALRTTIWTGLGWFQSLNYAVNNSIYMIQSCNTSFFLD
jgi:hypothetical protein